MAVRVSFDSNAWEKVFADDGPAFAPVRAALADGRMAGFISAASFQIEAIRKRDRAGYFSQPYMDVWSDGLVERDGQTYLKFSMAPDHERHHDMPEIQAIRLHRACAAGVKLMYGQNWLGLPSPHELLDRSLYVAEEMAAAERREQRQLLVSAEIDKRGLGNAAFEAAGGWEERSRTPVEERRLVKACAEWADGELAAAHIAYDHDILCTDDQGIGAGRSIFDLEHRAWLTADFGVTFMSVDGLVRGIS